MRAQELRALGSFRGVETGIPRIGAGPEEPIPDDRFARGARPSAGGYGPQRREADRAFGGHKVAERSRSTCRPANWAPLSFTITAGQLADCTQAIALLRGSLTEAFIADKGYDSDTLAEHIKTAGAEAVILPRSNLGVQRGYDEPLCRKQNQIERSSSKQRQSLCFARRHEQSQTRIHALVSLACTRILNKLYFHLAKDISGYNSSISGI